MNEFELGRIIENISSRLEKLETSLMNFENSDALVEETVEDSFTVELTPDSIERLENNVIVRMDDNTLAPRIFLSGQKTTGRDREGRWGRYSGTVWLQDNVGRNLVWFYIETGSDNICNLLYPNFASGRGAHMEARNTHVFRFGWRGLWRPGQGGASSWGRLVDSRGSGWICRWGAGC